MGQNSSIPQLHMSTNDSPQGEDTRPEDGSPRFQFGLRWLFMVTVAWAVLLSLSQQFGILLLYWGVASVVGSFLLAMLFGWKTRRVTQAFIGGMVGTIVSLGILILLLVLFHPAGSSWILNIRGPYQLHALLGSIWLYGLLIGGFVGLLIDQRLSRILTVATWVGSFAAAIPVVGLFLYELNRQNWHPVLFFFGIVSSVGAFFLGGIVGMILALLMKAMWGLKR